MSGTAAQSDRVPESVRPVTQARPQRAPVHCLRGGTAAERGDARTLASAVQAKLAAVAEPKLSVAFILLHEFTLFAFSGFVDALRIAGFTVNQSRLQRAAWRLANQLEVPGKHRIDVAPLRLMESVNYALSADLPSSSRVRLMRDISACHAERVRVGLSWTSGIVEPLGICFVGFVVAMVVIGLFLPLVKLVEGLSG